MSVLPVLTTVHLRLLVPTLPEASHVPVTQDTSVMEPPVPRAMELANIKMTMDRVHAKLALLDILDCLTATNLTRTATTVNVSTLL